MTHPLDLAGKDYFTEPEAAAYSCVSESQFRAKRAEYGIHGFWWMGKKVYRKVDIQRAMENAWTRSPIGSVFEQSSKKRERMLGVDGRSKPRRVRTVPDGVRPADGTSGVVVAISGRSPE